MPLTIGGPVVAWFCTRIRIALSADRCFWSVFVPVRTECMENTVRPRFPGLIGLFCLLMACAHSCLGQPPPSRENQRQAARAFEREGKVADAEVEWRSLLTSQPSDPEAFAHLGLLEARQEHYKEAIVDYRKALSLNPKMPNLRMNLGLSLFKSGDLRAAIETFEPLLKSEPKSSPEALRLVTLIGMADYGLGFYASSVPYLKEAAVGDPQNLQLHMMLAHSCLWTKQYQCVLDVYRQILALNAESAEADMLVGEAYDELKNDEGALTEFQAAVKADPKTPNVHFGYGYLLWKALKFEEAQKEFQSELANDPEHALALAYLGDTEMRASRSDESLQHLEHAVRIQPLIEIAHLDLGIIYESRGRNDDALKELKKAEKLRPEDPTIHWRLGRFYQSVGRKAEAKSEFDRARNLQQADEQSLREKLHQVDSKPAEQKGDADPK